MQYHTLSLLGKRLLKGGVWAITTRGMSLSLGIGLNIFLARVLSPRNFGIYFIALSVVTVSTVVAQLGLNYSVVRVIPEALAKNRGDIVRSTVMNAIMFTSVGALVVSGLIVFSPLRNFLIYVFPSLQLEYLLEYCGLWIIFLSLVRLESEIFRGFHDIRLASVFNELSATSIVLSIGLVDYLFFGTITMDGLLTIIIAANMITAMVGFTLIVKKLSDLPLGNFQKNKWRWPISISFWLSNLFLFLITKTDIWIIGFLCLPKNVALYGTASKMVMLISLPLLIINSVIPSSISELYSIKQNQKLEFLLRSAATIAAIPAVILFIIYIIFGLKIMGFAFGSFYKQAGDVLLILAIGQIFNVFSGSSGLTLLMTENQSVMMKITAFSGSITVLIGLLLTVKFGIVGMACAFSFGQMLQNLLMWQSVHRCLKIWSHCGKLNLYRLFQGAAS